MAKTESAANTQNSAERPLDTKRGIDDIAGRVAQTEEFRERAERWMKEITQQVARLAAQGEQDEKRRAAIDRRIADIEERLKSLLTLTELVSLDKNPFAAPRGAPAPAAPVPPAEAPKTAPESPAAAPRAVVRAHPNDAAAESAPPPIRLSDEEHGTGPASPGFHVDPGTDLETRRRLTALAWAELLAAASDAVDVTGVVAFYAESGWLDAATVRDAERLAARLRGMHPPRYQNERAVHEATIRLFGATGIGPGIISPAREA
jgi:hypothetical protein